MLWQKVQHISKTDQIIPQTNNGRQLISSKKNQFRAIHANFNPCILEVDKTRHIPTKNSKNNKFVVKSLLDSNCKRSATLQYEKTSN